MDIAPTETRLFAGNEARPSGGGRFAAHTIQQISRAERFDDMYGVYITRTDASALAAARTLDEAFARGDDLGPLAGTTVAVKDLIATNDAPTTAQSLVHEKHWFNGEDAPVVARLRAAGAIFTGKTSMAEHAAGRIDPTKPFPVPRNPWDPKRWPGGSSAGSAIAVSLGLSDAALGTDTTGSLRIPAAFCGITGFRPTTGLVDTAGCMPSSVTLDAVGPMARSARVCAEMLAVMAPETARSNAHGTPDGSTAAVWRDRLEGVRIGVPRDLLETWGQRIDPEVRIAFDLALADLEKLGGTIVEIDLPEWDVLAQATMIIAAEEMFVRHAAQLRARWSDYGRSFRRIAALGAFLTSGQTQAVRDGLVSARASLHERFETFEVIATPTWATVPPSYFAAVEMAADDLNLTAAWASAGLPCVATPMGSSTSGLPLSLQLAGRPGDDLRLLEIADCFEQNLSNMLARMIVRDGPMAAIPDPDSGRAPLTGDALDRLSAMFEGIGLRPDAHDLAVIGGVLRTLSTVT